MNKIDFVVTWVNGADKEWQKKKKKYSGKELKGMNSLTGYRDWGTLRYWFRGVEKFAPWVNKIYLVTDNQIPDWINQENSRLKIINHSDFLPDDALPVFNSNAIESMIYKLPGLNEQFVYFNDDMFLINSVTKEDFFKEGKPCDAALLYPIKPEKNGTAHFQVNNMEIINRHFTRKEINKNSKLLSFSYGIDNLRTVSQMICKFTPGFFEPHMPNAFLKDTFKKVWSQESDMLKKTTYSRFRDIDNISQWLFRDWQLASGNFIPRNNRKFGKYVNLTDNNEKVWQLIKESKYKVLCINDVSTLNTPEKVEKEFIYTLNKILPQKSSFEL